MFVFVEKNATCELKKKQPYAKTVVLTNPTEEKGWIDALGARPVHPFPSLGPSIPASLFVSFS